MSELLFHYEKVNPTTWAYLSSLMMIGLYFKFSRIWSVRNLDLLLLILLAPGLILAYHGQHAAEIVQRQWQDRVSSTADDSPADAPADAPPNSPANSPTDTPTKSSASDPSPSTVDRDPSGSTASASTVAEPSNSNSPASRSATRPLNPPASKPANKQASKPTSQSAKQPENQARNQPANQPANRSSNPSAESYSSKTNSTADPIANSTGSTQASAAQAKTSSGSQANGSQANGSQAGGSQANGAPVGSVAAALSRKSEGKRSIEQLEADWRESRRVAAVGYIWLILAGGVWLTRLLLDPTMARRPLLEPNLSTGGMIFLAVSLFVFLMANVIASDPTPDDLSGPQGAGALLGRQSLAESEQDLTRLGPGYALLNLLPILPTMSLSETSKATGQPDANAVAAKLMATLSHFAVVFGIVIVGYRHFDNFRMGVGAATLYLMLPCTALMTGRVDHVLPAALLLWAVVSYRRPLSAGIFIGLATGVVYYPIFLLPLWLSFYWQRGIWRFLGGLAATLALMIVSLAFVSADFAQFQANVQKMFGLWLPVRVGLGGIWGLGWDPVYRLPVLAAFVAISGSLAIWPAQKNLGTLLSCSAAIIVATQFWHPHGGGLYITWYLPLLLLTVFRPNLEDRVALTVLSRQAA
ncbi:MAG: hypothetical protein ACKO38_01480 [Planctomycetota bacterium]